MKPIILSDLEAAAQKWQNDASRDVVVRLCRALRACVINGRTLSTDWNIDMILQEYRIAVDGPAEEKQR